MSEPQEHSSEIALKEKALLDELLSFDDWKERYAYILDLGADLETFPEEFRREEFKVKGCVSQVWLVGKVENKKMLYWADSDSLFVKGLAALLLKIFTGSTPHEVKNHSGNILIESGLIQNLSPNRVNGAASMLAKIKEIAKPL